MRRRHAALIPVVLTAVVYAPVVHFGFVELDDPYYVYDNPQLAGAHGWAAVRYALTTFTGGNWHPLVWLSYFLDRQLWHLSPGPMHAENAALHAVSGVLVLLLLADATGSLARATVCAAVFAVHPMHVESVAWVSERKDVLSTAWLLAAAWAYVQWTRVRTPRGGPTWYAAVIACYALSLSAKSMGVTLPFVLLLLDVWPLDRLRGAVGRRVLEKLPLLAMAAAASAVAFAAQRSVGATEAVHTSMPDRLGNAAVSTVRYVADLFWPADLAAFYPFRPQPVAAGCAAAVLLMAITVIAVRLRRRRPYLLVGWLWFAGTLLPVCGIVQVGMQARADRYVYFPSVGLSVAAVWLAADLLAAAPVAAPAVAAAVLGGLTVAGRWQVGYWSDTRTLFEHAVAVTDGNYLALDYLGRDALRRGDLRTAVSDLTRSLSARGDFAPAYADLGRCALRAGRPAEAVTAYTSAVGYAPAVTAYRIGLADALEAAGRHADAVTECRAAVALDPGSADAHATLNRLEH